MALWNIGVHMHGLSIYGPIDIDDQEAVYIYESYTQYIQDTSAVYTYPFKRHIPRDTFMPSKDIYIRVIHAVYTRHKCSVYMSLQKTYPFKKGSL